MAIAVPPGHRTQEGNRIRPSHCLHQPHGMNATPMGSVFPRHNYLPSMKSLLMCAGENVLTSSRLPHMGSAITSPRHPQAVPKSHGWNLLRLAPSHAGLWPSTGMPQEPARSWQGWDGRQGPGSCARCPNSQPQKRVSGQKSGHPLQPPAPSLPSKSCGSPASGEALFWRWSREPSPNPLESPAPR